MQCVARCVGSYRLGAFRLNRRPVPWRLRTSVAESILFRRKTLSDVVDELEDETTLELVKKLDPRFQLWFDPDQKKVSGAQAFEVAKNDHPNKLVLVRSGEHYEGVGIDAVMLMHYGEMRLVSEDPPRVRCSCLNLPYHLRLVVQKHGFEVVIWEALSRTDARSPGKSRYYEAAVIRGAGDTFYLNSVDDADLMALTMDSEKTYPLAAVYWSQSGFALIQYFSKENAMRVTTRLSEEGLWAKLNSTGLTPPLYLHSSSLSAAKIDSAVQYWQKKARQIAVSVFGSVEPYYAEDPMEGFVQQILNTDSSLDVRRASRLNEDVSGRTAPPPLSTVNELGITPLRRGIVLPLVEALLPPSCPKIVSNWMKKCIMDPPHPKIALEIQRLCRDLSVTPCSIPQLNARLAPSRLTEVLTQRKWNVEFLDEIRRLLKGVTAFVEDPGTEMLSTSLLKIVERDVGVPIVKSDFLKECRDCLSHIDHLLKEDLKECYERSGRDGPTRADTRSLSDAAQEKVYGRFLENTKPALYYCSNPERSAAIDQDLAAAERHLVQNYVDVFLPWSEQMGLSRVRFDSGNCIIAVKNEGGMKRLPNNDDAKRRPVGASYYEAAHLRDALSHYREALLDWENRFRAEIEELVEHLHSVLPRLISAAYASIILTALAQHVTQAEENEWVLPDITNLVYRSRQSLDIQEFWPYWMQKQAGTTNSVLLDRMAILTGPNMAGKSTILRSIAAVCCLGVCGFFVPAKSATLPFMDCVNLKTLLTDSPLENLSAFAVEMTEMKHVLQDATAHTLVLIDELGKGTEVIGGTALSTAIFKELYDRGVVGIFATHLHRIEDFKMDFPEAAFYRMEIGRTANGDREATWKLCPGFCEESLGLEVALRQGIPDSIVQRAKELMSTIDATRQSERV